jgi:spore germination protein YaaH
MRRFRAAGRRADGAVVRAGPPPCRPPLRLISALLGLAACLAAAATAPAAPRPEAVGFYVPWDPQAKSSLTARAGALTVFAPQWVVLADAAGTLRFVDDPAAQAILSAAQRRPRVMPLVANAHDAQWDAQGADAVLLDPARRAAFVAELADAAEARGFDGYVLDFENLSPQGQAAYPALAAALRAALAPTRKPLWVTLTFPADPAALRAFAAAADATVLMGYDECWATSTPGPVAGVDWLAAGLAAQGKLAAPGRTVVALGAYGYDWTIGGPAKVLSVPAALELAKASGAALRREPLSANLTFDYRDAAGRAHQVWMTDGLAVAAARRAAARAGYRNWGLWRLGLEDPATWGGAPAAGDAPASAPKAPHCEPLPK